jgi:nitrite reductase/ring-hydroxylating ferredoxin subunit/uncharacterized membrane protein
MVTIDPRKVAETLEETEGLDRLADPVASRVSSALQGPAKDLLSGSWLGHPIHPLLVALPIGAWTSASLLDLVGGRRGRGAADTLVAAGIVSALPTALTGLNDWSDLEQRQRRVGLVHASANSAALTLYVASLLARRRGRRLTGGVLALMGAAAMSAGGYLGGHLAYRLGAGMNRNAFEELPEEWTPVADLAELPDGEPSLRSAGSLDILMVRRGERVDALLDRCNHLGGPLHEGRIEGDTVVCPWHASTFRLADGEVVHGPASAPQPTFEVRAAAGKVEVRRRGGGRRPGHGEE